MTAPPSNRPTATSRWAALVVTAAMAVALVGTSVGGAMQARRAADQLVMSQAEHLRASARVLRRSHPQRLQESLEDFVQDWYDEGLRYVGVYRDGELLAEAGEARRRPLPPPAGPQIHLEPAGDRVRAVAWGPPRRPMRRLRAPGPPHALVFEFEPVLADSLRLGASRSVAIGGASALLLLVLAGFLWRRSVAAEQAALALQRERHLATLGEMSAVLGHEIKNPLASLKGNAQLLARKLDSDSPLRTKADRVVDEATRLEVLTRRILTFARRHDLNLEPCDPRELTREVIDRVGEGRVALHLDDAPERWVLDPGWFPQALENVVHNAVRATEGGGSVSVSLRREGGALRWDVSDEGPGFADGPPDFQPFHTTRVQGTGLGLAIARRVMDDHGGGITATNRADGGALLTLTLPERGS